MGSSSVFTGIVGAAIILWGAWSIYKGFRMNAMVNRTKGWPYTSGRISEVRIETRITRNNNSRGLSPRTVRYEPVMTYEYKVGGSTYTGVKMHAIPKTYRKSKAEELAAEYPVGAVVPVYYDPNMPDEAVLVQGGGGAVGTILGGLAMIVLGGVVLYGMGIFN